MKFCKVSLFAALVITVCLAGVAQAQIQVNVPFSFTAAGKVLPAGRYIVGAVFDMDQAAWRLSYNSGGTMVLTNHAESAKKPHQPGLVFLLADGQYSLVEIRTAGLEGRELLLRTKVTTTLLAEGAKYVEIGAE
jgi:hypothetical protein